MTFPRLSDILHTPFGMPILDIFNHRQFENFVQILMLADLIFKEKSNTINIRNGMLLIINLNCLKHSLSNIASK